MRGHLHGGQRAALLEDQAIVGLLIEAAGSGLGEVQTAVVLAGVGLSREVHIGELRAVQDHELKRAHLRGARGRRGVGADGPSTGVRRTAAVTTTCWRGQAHGRQGQPGGRGPGAGMDGDVHEIPP